MVGFLAGVFKILANALNLAGDSLELHQETVNHSVRVLFAFLCRVRNFRQEIDRASLCGKYPGLNEFFVEGLPLPVATRFPATGYEDSLLNFPLRLKGKEAHRLLPRSLGTDYLFRRLLIDTLHDETLPTYLAREYLAYHLGSNIVHNSNVDIAASVYIHKRLPDVYWFQRYICIRQRINSPVSSPTFLPLRHHADIFCLTLS
jgi:hypothetical protein